MSRSTTSSLFLIHTRKNSGNHGNKEGCGGKRTAIHTIIKKILPGLKTIQSITLGITRWIRGVTKGAKKRFHDQDPIMASRWKKSFSKERDPLGFFRRP
jgi:hypothetical protein